MNEHVDGYEYLQGIGAQTIHEDTHIPKEHTRGLVNATFTNMNKIQFLGFISILEREYSLDLGSLKKKGLEYFEDNAQEFTIAQKVFVAVPKKKSFAKYYILTAIIIFALVIAGNMFISQEVKKTPHIVDNTSISTATKSIAPKIEQVMLDEAKKEEEKRLAATFKILPKALLWVGYIDLNTGKKYQKTFKDELALDPHGHWLLTLGHGNVDFDVNGELQQFTTSRNLRFVYQDGELKKIRSAEFKKLNKGEKW